MNSTMQVMSLAGVRHKGEVLNGVPKSIKQTIDHICNKVVVLLNIQAGVAALLKTFTVKQGTF